MFVCNLLIHTQVKYLREKLLYVRLDTQAIHH